MPKGSAGQDLVYVEPSSVKALQRLARELKQRGDGKEVKKRLNRAIKDATKPLQDEIKANARGLEFTGRGRGDRKRRSTRWKVVEETRRGEVTGTKQVVNKKTGKVSTRNTYARVGTGNFSAKVARKGKGLRDLMADGIKTEISYRAGAGAGVRIRLKSSDAEVNRIGMALNRRGKVRHPVFGNRENWADTVATNGKDWFYGPVPKHRDDVTRNVKRAIDAELNKLARDIG